MEDRAAVGGSSVNESTVRKWRKQEHDLHYVKTRVSKGTKRGGYSQIVYYVLQLNNVEIYCEKVV